MAGKDLGNLLGGLLGGQSAGGGNIVGSLLGTLGRSNGAGSGNPLEGLLRALSAGGLGEQAQSWISRGRNRPVTGDDLIDALPPDVLLEVAHRESMSPHEAAERLADVLPRTVDELTPRGRLPQSGSLDEVIKQQQLG